jgi:hypothetical protein
MSDRDKNIAIAVAALEESKKKVMDRCKREVAELDRTIRNLKNMSTSLNWEGMALPEAVHAYLANYHSPVPFCDLMSGLMERGVFLGDESKPQRFQANLKTTIVSNHRRFGYNKTKDTVRLLRTSKQRDEESESEQAAAAS